MRASAPSKGRLWQLALAACTLCVGTAFAFHEGWFAYTGISHFEQWFIDFYAILASNDAAALGRDPYAYNALDYFGRPHVYSYWWLGLRRLHLTRADTPFLGLGLALVFLAAAVARLRARTGREFLWFVAFLCSPPVLFAVERANNDLVIFILLAPVVPLVLSDRLGQRLAAVGLIGLCAGLKFYPAVAVLVLLHGRDRRQAWAGLIAAAAILALVSWNVAGEAARIGAHLPHPEGSMTLGAVRLLGEMGVSGSAATGLGLAAAAVAALVFARKDAFGAWRPQPEDEDRWLGFVLGAGILCGCFFSGSSYSYRWIFALWMAPFLWGVVRDPSAPLFLRRLSRFMGAALLVNLWADSAIAAAATILIRSPGRWPVAKIDQWGNVLFRLEQVFTWALFLCLVGLLVRFVRNSAANLSARRIS